MAEILLYTFNTAKVQREGSTYVTIYKSYFS